MDYYIDKMISGHWEQVRDIYNEGIESGNSTFEKEAPAWQEWNESHIDSCRLVARKGDKIYGWAALSPVSSRCVYKGVAEVSVYVGSAFHGKGLEQVC
ncbi:MAG: N-acetyltransferase family protein [Halanaerobiales bacterium]